MFDKLKFFYTTNKKRFELIIERLDFIIFILYGLFVFEAFLRSTTFEINWHPYYHISLKIILILLVLVKSLLKFMDNIPLYMLLGFCSMGFFLAYLQGNYGILLELILFTIAFVDIDFNKIITIFTLVIGVSLFIVVIGSQTGILNNIVYTTSEHITRISFGIHYPTNFASYILFICLAWGFNRKEKISFTGFFIMLGMSIYIYHYCNARTSTLCMLFFIVALFVYKLIKRGIFIKISSCILSYAIPVCALFSIFFAYFYSPNNKFLNKLNLYLSNRLNIGKSYFNTTNIHLFGQTIEMKGNGGFTLSGYNYFSNGNLGYNFIDSSYLSILFRYGLFVFVCVIVLFTFTSFVSKKHHDYVSLIIIAIIAIHSIMEHHMLDFNYNPFTFLLISSYYGRHCKKRGEYTSNKEQEVQV